MTREKQVEIFNKIMGQEVGSDPDSVQLKLRQLGINLIFEENYELASASGVEEAFYNLCKKYIQIIDEKGLVKDGAPVNKVLQLDGLCDVQYTTSWAVNVFGHQEHFQSAFEETCRSNNSKATLVFAEALKTKEHWEQTDKEPHYIDEVKLNGERYYVVKRQSDSKVKKSIFYSPANFEQFIKS